MKRGHYIFSILALIICILAVSCTMQRVPDETLPQTTPENRQTRFDPGVTPAPRRARQENFRRDMRDSMIRDSDRNENGRNISPMNTNMQERAERVANAAARVKEVESATCLITGNTAMVGLQFNEQYKGQLTDSIKRQVEKRVRETDNRINRVVVTADPDLVSRIEEIFREIGNGRPISGFTEEINEMINRINPK